MSSFRRERTHYFKTGFAEMYEIQKNDMLQDKTKQYVQLFE